MVTGVPDFMKPNINPLAEQKVNQFLAPREYGVFTVPEPLEKLVYLLLARGLIFGFHEIGNTGHHGPAKNERRAAQLSPCSLFTAWVRHMRATATWPY